MSIVVREFRRSDREQLASLINLHVAAVLPGVALSTNVILSQLEGEPGELVVDPWVEQRICLVAEQDDAVVAATLLHRFGHHERVREGYRSAAEIRWLVFAPSAQRAAENLMADALDRISAWQPSNVYADGTLPAPGCYGVPSVWPHVRALYTAAGFAGPTRQETVLVAHCRQLRGHVVPGTRVQRAVGHLGVRLDLVGDGGSVGYIEVGEMSPAMSRSAAATTWTDVGNLFALGEASLADVMPGLFSAAADWLLLGGVERIIDYYAPDVHTPEYMEILTELGFTVLTVNERGWSRPPAVG